MTRAHWFADAKLGIIFSWGVHSVPGFTPPTDAEPGSVSWFRDTPRGSWYLNGLRQQGSAVRAYHRAHYGMHTSYARLAERFLEVAEGRDPASWADLARETGARYVILPAKDLDGFLMWPGSSATDGLVSQLDLLGPVVERVRSHGMKLGLGYSAGLDWPLQEAPLTRLSDLTRTWRGTISQRQYSRLVVEHLSELLATHEPDILHNLSHLALHATVRQLLRGKSALSAVLSGSWVSGGTRLDERRLTNERRRGTPLSEWFARIRAERHGRKPTLHAPVISHGMPSKPRSTPWQYLHRLSQGADDSLIHLLATVVSLNGNLLLEISPHANGAVPAEQSEQLAPLARWLRLNQESIYGTRPWKLPGTTAEGGVPVRYTARRDALYAIVLGRPAKLAVDLQGLDPNTLPQPSEKDPRDYRLVATVLGAGREVDWRRTASGVSVDLPGSFVPDEATVIRFRWQL